jgi:hypothetical protein
MPGARLRTKFSTADRVLEYSLTATCIRADVRVAMVAEVSCNLTPRRPPSQVLDNLPEIAG